MGTTIYDRLGTRPVINALGIYTDLGGSILSPTVWAAMGEANQSFAGMVELLDRTGEIIAGLVGAEAARVTPGASAAIALGTAACLTGDDGRKMELLPETTGMPAELVIQRRHRYKYDRCARLAGARLVEAGDDAGTSRAAIEAAIGPHTAALYAPAHLDGLAGTVPLAEMTAIAHAHGLPMLLDAAFQVDPPSTIGRLAGGGADLVCFSAKYFGGPNAGGFICGRKDLIATVAGVDFTRYESGRFRTFGRAFKLDRQIIVGVVVALQEWLAMDHAARLARYDRLVGRLRRDLEDLPGLEMTPMNFTMQETLEPDPVNCLHLRIGQQSGSTAEQVAARLQADNPSILVHRYDDALIVVAETLRDGDEALIATRLRAALAS